jgi:FkbM family methyltransferase
LFLQRFDIAFGYYREPLRQMWLWLHESGEVSNFLYPVVSQSRDYMISMVADVTGKSYIEIAHYFYELENDWELIDHIRRFARDEDGLLLTNPEKVYGRRLIWYAFVRAVKPTIVVEAGIEKGLGSCILAAALVRNRKKGYEGYYYGTDINPDAGYLLGEGEYAKTAEILYGDSIHSLQDFHKQIDLFINDDDHSTEYEAQEYRVIAGNLSGDAVILGDNAHKTDYLLKFARATNRRFVFIPEKPAEHWYPGAGAGVAFRRHPQPCDVFDMHLKYSTERYGEDAQSWILCPDGLSKESVVYSVGVGEDISFDLSLIERYGVAVYAFDPTPKSVDWVEQQDLPNLFHFVEMAISDFNGTSLFYPPENPAHISHSLLNANRGDGSPIRVQTRRLSTLMDDLDHNHVDVLKLDIEGAEYAVIVDLLQSGLDVRQLLVEFHHRFEGIGIEKTKDMIRKLKTNGYQLFAISSDNLNYSFVKKS